MKVSSSVTRVPVRLQCVKPSRRRGQWDMDVIRAFVHRRGQIPLLHQLHALSCTVPPFGHPDPGQGAPFGMTKVIQCDKVGNSWILD